MSIPPSSTPLSTLCPSRPLFRVIPKRARRPPLLRIARVGRVDRVRKRLVQEPRLRAHACDPCAQVRVRGERKPVGLVDAADIGEQRDVRDGVVVAGDEVARSQLRIEDFQPAPRALAFRIDQRRRTPGQLAGPPPVPQRPALALAPPLPAAPPTPPLPNN